MTQPEAHPEHRGEDVVSDGLRAAAEAAVEFLQYTSWDNAKDEELAWTVLDKLRAALSSLPPPDAGLLAALDTLVRAVGDYKWLLNGRDKTGRCTLGCEAAEGQYHAEDCPAGVLSTAYLEAVAALAALSSPETTPAAAHYWVDDHGVANGGNVPTTPAGVLPPNTRLILASDNLLEEWGTRTDRGERITVEWGEPSPEGWYQPVFTVHSDDLAGVLDEAALAAIPMPDWHDKPSYVHGWNTAMAAVRAALGRSGSGGGDKPETMNEWLRDHYTEGMTRPTETPE